MTRYDANVRRKRRQTDRKEGRVRDLDGQDTILEKRGAVAKITINRPEKRNALSRAAIREMLAVLEELRADDDIAWC